MSAATSLHLPAPIAAVAFGSFGRLSVASEDGTVRVYDAPYSKVAKAVKTMSPEVSSLVFQLNKGNDEELWIACGQHVLCFSLGNPRMILERKDAGLDIRLTDEDDDVLNEININATHLAYTLDSGVVGILDLQSHGQTRMKVSHSNLCSNVSFIPDRPREIVSGGYDSTLLHFDFHLGTLLSSLQICLSITTCHTASELLYTLLAGPAEPSAQVSLSPPFVLSLSVSQTGLVACGLADGRIWLGSGGEKVFSSEESSNARKKKRRKWEGLRATDVHYHKVAEGPIVAVAFVSQNLLLSLTLLGTLTMHQVEGGQIHHAVWTVDSPGLVKANALAVHGESIAIGGISANQKGILMLRSLQSGDTETS